VRFARGNSKLITWFTGKRINHREVNAIINVDVRKELCAISKINGNYPQVFVTDGELTTFVGGFDEIEHVSCSPRFGAPGPSGVHAPGRARRLDGAPPAAGCLARDDPPNHFAGDRDGPPNECR
jgi:hypothetical protein